MSTIGYENPTLMDVARRIDPNGKIATIVELLSETNDILKYMTAVECNNGTSHKTTVRTGLPSATWRLLNYGVQPSKSQTKQVSDACGMLEAYAEVDKALADLNGNTAAFRLSEDRAFLEAMNQEMATTLFYGNTTLEPEKFNGLALRYNALPDGRREAVHLQRGERHRLRRRQHQHLADRLGPEQGPRPVPQGASRRAQPP